MGCILMKVGKIRVKLEMTKCPCGAEEQYYRKQAILKEIVISVIYVVYMLAWGGWS